MCANMWGHVRTSVRLVLRSDGVMIEDDATDDDEDCACDR